MHDFLRASAWLLGDGVFFIWGVYELWSLRARKPPKGDDPEDPDAGPPP